jgi:CRP-like cAMP-binding protein
MSKELWEDYFRAVLKQEWEKSLSLLQELERSEPDNPQIHLRKGDVLQRTGDTPGAVASYHQSASGLMKAGFGQKALGVYNIILKVAPNDGEAAARSGEILADMESGGSVPFTEHLEAADPVDEAVLYDKDAASPDETFSSPQDVREPGDKAQPAEKVPHIFASLSAEEYAELKKAATHMTFNNEDPVVEEGDTGESIFTITSGQALVVTHIQNRTLVIAKLSEGDFFGEVSFLTKRPRTATVTAFGVLSVMEINRDIIKNIKDSHPQILERLVEFYYSRVKDTLHKLKDEKTFPPPPD